jgi:hypothetical protein
MDPWGYNILDKAIQICEIGNRSLHSKDHGQGLAEGVPSPAAPAGGKRRLRWPQQASQHSRRPLNEITEGIMETFTMIGFGLVLLVWLYGYSALLFRKPHTHG